MADWPKGTYRLTETAYMPRVPGGVSEHLAAGTEVVYEGKPGPHMEPLDSGAKDARKRADEGETATVGLGGPGPVADPTKDPFFGGVNPAEVTANQVAPNAVPAQVDETDMSKRTEATTPATPPPPPPPPRPAGK